LKRIRFGVIGLRRGADHAKSVARSERSVLVALSDVRIEACNRLARELGAEACYDDYRDLIQRTDIDAVVISTPNDLHARMCIDSLERGLHVLVEKPMCVSLSEADEISRAVEKTEKKLYVGYNKRLTPAHGRIKQIIENYELGKALYATSVLKAWRPESYYMEAPWRSKLEKQGGGVLMNPGSHGLETSLWWFGQVKSVLGFCENLCHDLEVEDTATAIIKFQSGVTLNLLATTALRGSVGRTEIDFSDGALALDGLSLTAKRKDETNWREIELPSLERNTTDIQLELFLDSIENDTDPPVGPAEGRRAVELALAIYRSSRLGRQIRLPL